MVSTGCLRTNMNSQLGKILIILFIIFLKFAYSETINPSSEIIFILSFDIFSLFLMRFLVNFLYVYNKGENYHHILVLI